MNPEEKRSWELFLARVPLFADLRSSELARVAGRMHLLSLPKGAVLYAQGDEVDALYIIASGQVRLINPQKGPGEVIALLGRGDTLGEAALLAGERRSTSVVLDTTCEFLKLQRKDFEALIKENPLILMQVSRALSSRLVETGSPAKDHRPGTSQLVTLNAALARDDRLVLIHQLALALVEQTRRRVLLVDMGPDAGAAARALGLRPAPATETMIRSLDSHDPASCRAIVQQHHSGLDILTLPAGVLGGRLYSGIYLFLNHLRDAYDFVLTGLGSDLGDVERSILAEADQAVVAGSHAWRPLYRQLEAELGGAVPERSRLIRVWLGELDPEVTVFPQGAPRMSIPWSGGVSASLQSTGSPYHALESEPRALKAIERLARMLGGVQVGLALGSGAALGFSLIGLLKVFRRENIPIDMISGTSIGSLVGGVAALGMDPEEFQEIATSVDKSWLYENLLWDLTLPRSGLFAGQTLLRFIRSYFGTKEFQDLELPFSCVATDIETGEEIILGSGRVAEAVRASCGLPLLFSPMRIEGRYLVDGGLVAPVPTRAVSELGADIVIAANLTLPPGARMAGRRARQGEKSLGVSGLPVDLASLRELALPELLKSPNVVEIFFQMIYTMEYEIARTRMEHAHLVIQPDLAGFSWTEMHRAKEIIALGERIAEEYIPRIKALIPFFADDGRTPIR